MLGELGKQLADRWLSLLVLPGALFLAVVFAAHTLGQTHALSVSQLIHQVTADAKSPVVTSVGGQVVLLAAVLAASAGSGVLAQALGSLIETAVLAAGWREWPEQLSALVARRVTSRQSRWDAADEKYYGLYRQALAPDPADRPSPTALRAAARKRNRISREWPERPTWSGDRISAAAVCLDRDLHLDLATLWPHLWLTLPEQDRTQITIARGDMARAATLGGWAILYAPLTWWWWPAASLTVILAAAARHRIRLAAETYALLLEAAARLHVGALATELGMDHQGPLTRQLGDELTRYLRSSPPPPHQHATSTS
jgi:hypothetical protein